MAQADSTFRWLLRDDPRPQAGDILIAPLRPSSDQHVAISVVPGPRQMVFRCREAALDRIRPFATTRQVDVWVAGDGQPPARVAWNRRSA